MSDQGVSRRPAVLVAGLLGLSLVCGIVAFLAFGLGMVCDPSSGVGCDSTDLSRMSFAAAGVAAGLSGGLLGAAISRHKAVIGAVAAVGVAILLYATTQIS